MVEGSNDRRHPTVPLHNKGRLPRVLISGLRTSIQNYGNHAGRGSSAALGKDVTDSVTSIDAKEKVKLALSDAQASRATAEADVEKVRNPMGTNDRIQKRCATLRNPRLGMRLHSLVWGAVFASVMLDGKIRFLMEMEESRKAVDVGCSFWL